MTQNELIANPGYICEKLGYQNFYLREIPVPESILIELENRIEQKDILYSIGKKFGWCYSLNSRFPKISESEKNKFIEHSHFLVRYMESASYGKDLSEKVDYEKKIFDLHMKDYIVCSKNGQGQLFSEGGIGGIWAWFVEDKDVECIHKSCQGRGSNGCEVIAAPYSTLVNMGLKPFRCEELEDLSFDVSYMDLNKITPAKWTQNSLKTLMDSGIIKYNHGLITYGDERFFLCESTFIYLLERELKKVNGAGEILWNVCSNFGRKLCQLSKKQMPGKFIMDFFPALGFGNIIVSHEEGKYRIGVDHFPWTKLYDDIDFIFLRAIFSGYISEYEGKEIRLGEMKKSLTSEDCLSISFSS